MAILLLRLSLFTPLLLSGTQEQTKIRAHNHIITVRGGGRRGRGVEMGVIPPLPNILLHIYPPEIGQSVPKPDQITDCITRAAVSTCITHSTLQNRRAERQRNDMQCPLAFFFFLLHFLHTQHEHAHAQNAFLYHTFTLPFVGLSWWWWRWWWWSCGMSHTDDVHGAPFCWTRSVSERGVVVPVCGWVVRNTHSPDERFRFVVFFSPPLPFINP